jgi:tetratricopeptide (TPR) repeat protein
MKSRRVVVSLGGAVLLVAAGPALAQPSVSQPVVQQTTSAASLANLNAALKDLSRDQRNVSALLRAGWASLGINDTQAALGFFRRAQAIQPQSGEVKAGLASASLRLDDPATAVRLFAEAEASGTPMATYAGDRALALDLVGNNAGAQQIYRQALARNNDPEIIRRLALSQAIAGDQRGSDATLLPLLQHQDLAAYRTRAFALAILGKGEEAVSIAQTMLPAQISSRLAPYLRYMPRLTRAQQAAAANLGQFPPASEIGRDDPKIAAFSGSAPAAPPIASAEPDSRLVPAGQPLGPSGRQAASRASSRAQNASTPSDGGKGKNRDRGNGSGQVASVAPVPVAASAAPPPPLVLAAPSPPRVAAAVQPSAYEPAANKGVLVASLDPQPSLALPAPPREDAARPSISVATVAEQPVPQRVSLAEAFSEFAKLPASDAKPADGAVDISRVKPARETTELAKSKAEPEKAKAETSKAKVEPDKAKADKPKTKPVEKAKPKPPANPSRFWVQVATGRNVKALAFDWRKLQKQGGTLLKHDGYTAKWGATRRLLTGPYKTEAEADKAVAALKKKGFDAFEYTSDEGEEVTSLN